MTLSIASISLHFLFISSSFPHSLSISSSFPLHFLILSPFPRSPAARLQRVVTPWCLICHLFTHTCHNGHMLTFNTCHLCEKYTGSLIWPVTFSKITCDPQQLSGFTIFWHYGNLLTWRMWWHPHSESCEKCASSCLLGFTAFQRDNINPPKINYNCRAVSKLGLLEAD